MKRFLRPLMPPGGKGTGSFPAKGTSTEKRPPETSFPPAFTENPAVGRGKRGSVARRQRPACRFGGQAKPCPPYFHRFDGNRLDTRSCAAPSKTAVWASDAKPGGHRIITIRGTIPLPIAFQFCYFLFVFHHPTDSVPGITASALRKETRYQ